MIYYDVFDDIEKYPDAWLIEAHSARGTGKTYGALKGCMDRGIPFLYLKRTQIDIDLISNDDFSPFKPINRDTGSSVSFSKVYDGISQIKDGEQLLGYAMALSSIHKYKGFDLSEIRIMILDEYIPQLSERVNRKEGELLLDLYMTVSRDREARGMPPLKLLLFANATELYCPITDTLQIIDDLSELNASESEYKYLEERGILLHKIISQPELTEARIFSGMQDTRWARMAFGGEFAYNDQSKVKKVPLKGMVCHLRIRYNNQDFYIYQHKGNGLYYMCKSRGGYVDEFDMDIEADRRRFWLDYGIGLRQEIMDGNMFFSSYSAYNLIFNFTKLYKL